MIEHKPLISIIVPVYKTEQFLNKCIDSIINQTYPNFEIILVDDGSPDSCPQICDEYAHHDNRIFVIHKDNGGLSSARNAGIDKSTAEYLTFIDSDDYIEPEMIENIVKALTLQPDSDLVFIREKSVNIHGKTTHINGKKPTGNIILGDCSDAAKIIIGMQCNGMCDKTYRRSVIADLRVEIGKTHGEDLLFNLQYLCRVKKMVLVDKILYSYVCNEGSITHTGFNEHTTDAFYFRDKAREIIATYFPHYASLAHRRAFVSRQNVIRLLQKRHLSVYETQILIEAQRYLRTNYSSVSSALSKKERLEYYLLIMSKTLYRLYLKFIFFFKKIHEA